MIVEWIENTLMLNLLDASTHSPAIPQHRESRRYRSRGSVVAWVGSQRTPSSGSASGSGQYLLTCSKSWKMGRLRLTANLSACRSQKALSMRIGCTTTCTGTPSMI